MNVTRRSGRGGGCLTALAVLLGLALVAVGTGALWLVSTTQPSQVGEGDVSRAAPTSFEDYSWSELSEISAQIATAATPEEASAVASSRGIEVGDTRTMTLDDGTEVVVRVAGLAHDARADGAGRAGITLLTSPLALRRISPDEANKGGWEASELRSWLAGEGVDLLPDDLASVLVAVSKSTSNQAVRYGSRDVSAAVTQTADALWVPSLSEVCGDVTLMTDEYGTELGADTEFVDFAPYDRLLSSEGSQYEFFRAQGVSGASEASPALVASLSGEATPWWLRTSYPFTYTGSEERYCYQVMPSGLPAGLALASSEAGVVVGLCL